MNKIVNKKTKKYIHGGRLAPEDWLPAKNLDEFKTEYGGINVAKWYRDRLKNIKNKQWDSGWEQAKYLSTLLRTIRDNDRAIYTAWMAKNMKSGPDEVRRDPEFENLFRKKKFIEDSGLKQCMTEDSVQEWADKYANHAEWKYIIHILRQSIDDEDNDESEKHFYYKTLQECCMTQQNWLKILQVLNYPDLKAAHGTYSKKNYLCGDPNRDIELNIYGCSTLDNEVCLANMCVSLTNLNYAQILAILKPGSEYIPCGDCDDCDDIHIHNASILSNYDIEDIDKKTQYEIKGCAPRDESWSEKADGENEMVGSTDKFREQIMKPGTDYFATEGFSKAADDEGGWTPKFVRRSLRKVGTVGGLTYESQLYKYRENSYTLSRLIQQIMYLSFTAPQILFIADYLYRKQNEDALKMKKNNVEGAEFATIHGNLLVKIVKNSHKPESEGSGTTPWHSPPIKYWQTNPETAANISENDCILAMQNYLGDVCRKCAHTWKLTGKECMEHIKKTEAGKVRGTPGGGGCQDCQGFATHFEGDGTKLIKEIKKNPMEPYLLSSQKPKTAKWGWKDTAMLGAKSAAALATALLAPWAYMAVGVVGLLGIGKIVKRFTNQDVVEIYLRDFEPAGILNRAKNQSQGIGGIPMDLGLPTCSERFLIDLIDIYGTRKITTVFYEICSQFNLINGTIERAKIGEKLKEYYQGSDATPGHKMEDADIEAIIRSLDRIIEKEQNEREEILQAGGELPTEESLGFEHPAFYRNRGRSYYHRDKKYPLMVMSSANVKSKIQKRRKTQKGGGQTEEEMVDGEEYDDNDFQDGDWEEEHAMKYTGVLDSLIGEREKLEELLDDMEHEGVQEGNEEYDEIVEEYERIGKEIERLQEKMMEKVSFSTWEKVCLTGESKPRIYYDLKMKEARPDIGGMDNFFKEMRLDLDFHHTKKQPYVDKYLQQSDMMPPTEEYEKKYGTYKAAFDASWSGMSIKPRYIQQGLENANITTALQEGFIDWSDKVIREMDKKFYMNGDGEYICSPANINDEYEDALKNGGVLLPPSYMWRVDFNGLAQSERQNEEYRGVSLKGMNEQLVKTFYCPNGFTHVPTRDVKSFCCLGGVNADGLPNLPSYPSIWLSPEQYLNSDIYAVYDWRQKCNWVRDCSRASLVGSKEMELTTDRYTKYMLNEEDGKKVELDPRDMKEHWETARDKYNEAWAKLDISDLISNPNVQAINVFIKNVHGAFGQLFETKIREIAGTYVGKSVLENNFYKDVTTVWNKEIIDRSYAADTDDPASKEKAQSKIAVIIRNHQGWGKIKDARDAAFNFVMTALRHPAMMAPIIDLFRNFKQQVCAYISETLADYFESMRDYTPKQDVDYQQTSNEKLLRWGENLLVGLSNIDERAGWLAKEVKKTKGAMLGAYNGIMTTFSVASGGTLMNTLTYLWNTIWNATISAISASVHTTGGDLMRLHGLESIVNMFATPCLKAVQIQGVLIKANAYAQDPNKSYLTQYQDSLKDSFWENNQNLRLKQFAQSNPGEYFATVGAVGAVAGAAVAVTGIAVYALWVGMGVATVMTGGAAAVVVGVAAAGAVAGAAATVATASVLGDNESGDQINIKELADRIVQGQLNWLGQDLGKNSAFYINYQNRVKEGTAPKAANGEEFKPRNDSDKIPLQFVKWSTFEETAPNRLKAQGFFKGLLIDKFKALLEECKKWYVDPDGWNNLQLQKANKVKEPLINPVKFPLVSWARICMDGGCTNKAVDAKQAQDNLESGKWKTNAGGWELTSPFPTVDCLLKILVKEGEEAMGNEIQAQLDKDNSQIDAYIKNMNKLQSGFKAHELEKEKADMDKVKALDARIAPGKDPHAVGPLTIDMLKTEDSKAAFRELEAYNKQKQKEAEEELKKTEEKSKEVVEEKKKVAEEAIEKGEPVPVSKGWWW